MDFQASKCTVVLFGAFVILLTCGLFQCDEQQFHCDYGACISKEYQCDGLEQCFDGSDEKSEECDRIKSQHKRKRAASVTCEKPTLSLDRTINYNCPTNCDLINEFVVPNMTIAFVQCKPNFYMEPYASSVSVCFGGVWQSPIPNCYKRCDKLNPKNLNLKCYRNGNRIPCDEKSLIAGSTVRPTCKDLHRYADNVPPDYLQITCNENGRWDRQLFSCVPECGRSYTEIPLPTTNEGTHRISGGVEERSGEAPWHVAIYNANKVLICGGTIIHQYIVLSAAHCFDVNNTVDQNPKNYEVVVSKVTRDYNKRDNDYQKIHQIREIRTSEKGYFGRTNSFGADIVALFLEEKIEISASALPACIDWVSLSQKRNPAEDTLGKVSGWGLTGIETGTYSEKLLTTNLSFISHERCLRTVPNDFRDSVTFDKFCAVGAAGSGSAVLQGDSGGGFLLPQLNIEKQIFYYLRGIVSIKESSLTLIAVFTDLSNHYEWVIAARDEVEKRTTSLPKTSLAGTSGESICQSHNTSNCIRLQLCPIADLLIQTTKATFCGYDGDNADTERICCKLQVTPDISSTTSTTTTTLPPPPTTTTPSTTTQPPTTTSTSGPATTKLTQPTPTLPPPPPSPTPTPLQPQPKRPTESFKPTQRKPARTPAEIVSSYCDEYSKYATDCVTQVPPRGTRKPALLKEHPHIAYISCQSETANTFWTCEGSLISEWFVLSIAYCEVDGKGVAMRAYLGASISSVVKIEDQAEMYDIERTYIHPQYSYPSHSIALYKLKRPVTFNSYIRPACLSTWKAVKVNGVFSTVSWGTSQITNGKTKELQKGSITVVDAAKCSDVSNFDSKSMECAGCQTDGEALCLLTNGSPLQVAIGNASCVWSIYALWYGYMNLPKSCQDPGDVHPQLFTKIAYYLEWIQGIVWPTTSSTLNTEQISHVSVRTEPKLQERIRSPAEIASSYCERYSTYATECVADTPPKSTRRKAALKEYPHIAFIGCENIANSYWTCVGSLISERFVLSTAYCEIGGKGKAKWVHLGALIKSTQKSETYDKMYDVERSFIHPEYKFPRRSISLHKLKTSVTFNSYIRPACLYTSDFNQMNNELGIASWGTQTIPGSNSDDLLKGKITVVDDQRCSSVTGYDSDSMACAGDVSDGEALCLISTSVPLQGVKKNTSCVWLIYAMNCAHVTLPQSCKNVENAEPQLFTKISYYIDWIQGIVWP